MDSNDTERMVQSRRLLEQLAVSKDGKWRMDVLAAQLTPNKDICGERSESVEWSG